MIFEISTCLQSNLAHSKEKRNEIKKFIIRKQNDEAEKIVAWAKCLELLKKPRNEFISITKHLLCIKINHAEHKTENQKLKDEIENLKISYNEACERIEELENYIVLWQKAYEDWQSEINKYKFDAETNKNSLDQANKRIKMFEDDIKIKKNELEKCENNLTKKN